MYRRLEIDRYLCSMTISSGGLSGSVTYRDLPPVLLEALCVLIEHSVNQDRKTPKQASMYEMTFDPGNEGANTILVRNPGMRGETSVPVEILGLEGSRLLITIDDLLLSLTRTGRRWTK